MTVLPDKKMFRRSGRKIFKVIFIHNKIKISLACLQVYFVGWKRDLPLKKSNRTTNTQNNKYTKQLTDKICCLHQILVRFIFFHLSK